MANVVLIVDNILTVSDILRCSEQEGEYWQQPVPDIENEGSFKLISKGAPKDFNYNGVCTIDGFTSGDTIADSVLSVFGDNYFIGGGVTITSGSSSGESGTIIDSTQATGAITVSPAFSGIITSGTSFTLTVPYSTREFDIRLLNSGDAGIANFKWSHNGGDHYLSRDKIYRENWDVFPSATTYAGFTKAPIIQADNGDLLCIYYDPASEIFCRMLSEDGGLTWGSTIAITTSGTSCTSLIKLNSGVLQLYTYDDYNIYLNSSSDNGITWDNAKTSFLNISLGGVYLHACVKQLSNNNVILVAAEVASYDIYCYISSDNGINWTDGFPISMDGYTKGHIGLEEADNGNIICAYTNALGTGTYDIKCRLSKDGGRTWGDEIDVIDKDADSMSGVVLLKDINGRIYCFSRLKDKPIIVANYSDNSGDTWNGGGTSLPVMTASAHAFHGIPIYSASLIDGHRIVFSWPILSTSGNTFSIVPYTAGYWESFNASSSTAYCATNLIPQGLICDANLIWNGSSGVSGDNWAFEAAYYYGMENILKDSKNTYFRTEQDNIDCYLTFDMGNNVRFPFTALGLFNCNFRTAKFQMSAVSNFSAFLDLDISFDLCSGALDSACNGNTIEDSSLLINYKDHGLKNNYLRFTGGSEVYNTYSIKDNVGNYIFLDTTSALSVNSGDTFAIFAKDTCLISSTTIYRYFRYKIPAQETAEGYYRIGTALQGSAVSLSIGWQSEGKTTDYGLDFITLKNGSIVSFKNRNNKKTFQLKWSNSKEAREEILNIFNYVEGKSIVLIPDSSVTTECYLVKCTSTFNETLRKIDYYDFSLTFEEVV